MRSASTSRRGANAQRERRIVILTTFDLDEYVFEALRSGASGFLVKDTEPADLIRAVRAVAAGDSLLSPRATRSLIAEYATRAKPGDLSPSFDRLTDREREVTGHVAGGLSNDEIAERLYISPTTAKTHVSRAMTNSAPATGPNSSSTPTKPASSGPVGPTDHAMILLATATSV